MKCLFEEMWEHGVFSQRAAIPAVLSLDHAPALSIPPQIHIKVCLQKEMLGKYILKRSVTSLSRHQLEEEEEDGGAGGALLTVRTNQGWCLIWLYEISQEAGLVTDTPRVMLSDSLIYWGRRNNSHMVQVKWKRHSQGHYRGGWYCIQRRQNEDRSWEKYILTFSTQLQTFANWFLQPWSDTLRSSVLDCDWSSTCFQRRYSPPLR